MAEIAANSAKTDQGGLVCERRHTTPARGTAACAGAPALLAGIGDEVRGAFTPSAESREQPEPHEAEHGRSRDGNGAGGTGGGGHSRRTRHAPHHG